MSAATVGAVLTSRRPHHPAGWLRLGFGLSLSAAGAAGAYTNYGVARANEPPAVGLVALYLPATIVMAMACNGLVLLVTPTESLPSPRWRWLAGGTAATPIALLLVVTLMHRAGDRPVQAVESPLDLHAFNGVLLVAYRAAFTVAIIAFLVAAASLVVRFRRAGGIERQQLQWVALAMVDQTMQPTSVSLWLRPAGGALPDQRGASAFRPASSPAAASESVTAL